MSCTANSYDWNGACIPCSASLSDWAVVCGDRVFNSGACGLDGGRNLPCKTCLPGMTLVRTNAGISQWMGSRTGWPQGSTVCKYQCPMLFSSNPDPAAYPTQPCLNCTEQFRKASCSGMCRLRVRIALLSQANSDAQAPSTLMPARRTVVALGIRSMCRDAAHARQRWQAFNFLDRPALLREMRTASRCAIPRSALEFIFHWHAPSHSVRPSGVLHHPKTQCKPKDEGTCEARGHSDVRAVQR